MERQVNLSSLKNLRCYLSSCEIFEFVGAERWKMKETKELKKCPFCGGEAKIKMERKNNVGWTIWCECEKCYAKAEGYCPSMQNADNALKNINTCKINAIKAWNRRVEE